MNPLSSCLAKALEAAGLIPISTPSPRLDVIRPSMIVNIDTLDVQDTVRILGLPQFEGSVIRRISDVGVTLSTKGGLQVVACSTPAVLIAKGITPGKAPSSMRSTPKPPVAPPKPTVYQALAPNDLSLALKPHAQS